MHCLGGAPGALWPLRLRRAWSRERRYDLVHTHMPVPAVAARLAASGARAALVHTEHNVWERYRTADPAGRTRGPTGATTR